MRKGLFISFEGPDGSGKSTQIAALAEHLAQKNFDVILTREPGGTPIGEQIRNIILDRANGEMDAMTEAMLYAASRAQHVEEVIRPAIAAGKVVICDRFVDSSIAYQGYGRELGDAVRIINEYAVHGCMPDVTFFLDVNPEIGKERVSTRVAGEDRLEHEKMEFHRRVYAGYIALCAKEPRMIAIDAARSIDEIKSEIAGKVDAILQSWESGGTRHDF